jgi:5-methylthioadenosine/S-adenosylhomocysteine deaminase
MSADFVRDGTQLAIAEMLTAGITSFADMYPFPAEVARAAASAKVRAAIGLPVADAPSSWAEDATAHLARAESLWDEYKSDPWISLYFAPQGLVSISERTLARVRRVADELDARVAIALHESATDICESTRVHGRPPLQRLHDLGLLRPGFSGIYMNRLSAADRDLIAQTGISVIACVQSALRLGAGYSPLPQLDAQHVCIALGTADPLSAGAFDMLAETRAAALAAGRAAGDVGSGENPGATCDARLSALSVLRMATLGGATALGLGPLIGSIEPGKSADLVCWNLASPGAVFSPASLASVADSLVFGATRQQASDVWTSGRPAVSNTNLLAFDAQEVRAVAAQWAHRLQTGDIT